MNQATASHRGHNRKRADRWASLQIRTFFLVLGVFFLIGLAFWARPKTSLIEKRDLAVFPRLTASSLWNGDFFSDMTAWYADTYPARESMLSAEASLENLYGVRTEKVIVNSAATADEIPDIETVEVATVDFAALRASEEMERSVTEDELDADAPDGAIHEKPEIVGTVYIAGGCGFGVYYFNQDNVDAYVSMLNTVQDRLGEAVQVYAVPTPDSFGVMLDRSVQESLTQYEGDAFDYLFKRLSPSVVGVNVFNILVNHNAEYIFFHTDHHWTALGAYYAYRQFCGVKGFEPHELTDYQEYVSGEYLGTFYSYSNHSPELASNPDYIHAYYPLSTNTMMMETHDGQFLEFPIIREGSTYDLFIGSDEPFEEIDNPLISDGSACLIIKDSMGNAFVPFLVDHYDKVFVVDYRYYKGSLSQLIAEEGIDDVLFMNNIEFLSGSLASTCYDLFCFEDLPQATEAPAEGETAVQTAEAPAAGDTQAQTAEAPAEGNDQAQISEAPAEGDVQAQTAEAPAEGDAQAQAPEAPAEGDTAVQAAEAPAVRTTPVPTPEPEPHGVQSVDLEEPNDLLSFILGSMLADMPDEP